MAYCALADLQTKLSDEDLIALTDDDESGAIDTTNVNAAIAEADAQIDSYCSVAATVPFTTVPAIVKEWSKKLAVLALYHRRRKATPDEVKEDADAVIEHLKDVAAGKAGIPVTGTATSGDEVEASTTEDDRIFTTTTLGNY